MLQHSECYAPRPGSRLKSPGPRLQSRLYANVGTWKRSDGRDQVGGLLIGVGRRPPLFSPYCMRQSTVFWAYSRLRRSFSGHSPVLHDMGSRNFALWRYNVLEGAEPDRFAGLPGARTIHINLSERCHCRHHGAPGKPGTCLQASRESLTG